MDSLQNALNILKNHDVIGLPTETVYGLAAMVESEVAIKKIFETKERPFYDPLIVHVSSTNMAKKYVNEWSNVTEFLAKSFWPGPMTLILKKNPDLISDLITSGLDTVGIRFPSHPIAEKIISSLGTPLAAPSANKFKKTSPTKYQHVKDEFPDLFVLEGGDSEVGIESTIIMPTENELVILRPGIITEVELQEKISGSSDPHIRNLKISFQNKGNTPGSMKDHYCPKIPLYILESEDNLIDLPYQTGFELILPKDPLIAARLLYTILREGALDPKNEFIYVFKKEFENGGVWESIWDRLKKASINY